MPTKNDFMYNSIKTGSFEKIVGARLPESNLDAFGRLRVSDAVTLFDSQHQYDKQTLLWNEVTVGSANLQHNSAQACVKLNVTDADNDRAIKQTKQYFRYQPGKSQLVLMTGVFGESHANNTQKMGYFDSNNGIYLEYTNSQMYICLRSSANGSVEETRVSQSDWNINPLSGTQTPLVSNTASGTVLDPTKSQIFLADLEWLGVGRVRTGFVIDGAIYYTHEFLNANELDKVYMSTANLPVRYEIENTGPAVNTALSAICTSVISEGGVEEERGLPFSTATANTLVTVSGRTPVMTIRPAKTFLGQANRQQIVPSSIDMICTSGTVFVEIVHNGTLQNTTFTAVSANVSSVERDRYANTCAGGVVVDSFYIAGTPQSRGTRQTALKSKLPFTVNYDASNSDTITIVATNVGAAAIVGATISWKEFR